ncbi:MAG: hypothetical protein JWM44_367 [Bacilli bacterium]|nr:hypothetical protein [Bacilli bacterium]
MFNHERYNRLLVTFTLIAAFVQYFIFSADNIVIIIKIISTTTTVSLVFHWFFKEYLWKLKIFRLFIVRVPNLHGVWKGTIIPTNNDDRKEIECTLYIRQTFTTIHIEVHTDNMISKSYVAGFCIDNDAKNIELCYSYYSKSKIDQRVVNPWHEGASKLRVVEYGMFELIGEYWTSRKTTGEIKAKRVTTKIRR